MAPADVALKDDVNNKLNRWYEPDATQLTMTWGALNLTWNFNARVDISLWGYWEDASRLSMFSHAPVQLFSSDRTSSASTPSCKAAPPATTVSTHLVLVLSRTTRASATLGSGSHSALCRYEYEHKIVPM